MMLVVNRFDVTESTVPQFVQDARAAVEALAACPGFVRARLGAAMDVPDQWVLVTEWNDVGSYRRALSSFDVKMYGTPLLARALPEASAFEVTLAADGTDVTMFDTDRAPGIGLRPDETSRDDGLR